LAPEPNKNCIHLPKHIIIKAHRGGGVGYFTKLAVPSLYSIRWLMDDKLERFLKAADMAYLGTIQEFVFDITAEIRS
jgi:hypothetical protein